MQDVDAVDLVELADAVRELEQRDVVHGHAELLERAQDLHLQHSAAPPRVNIRQDVLRPALLI